MGLSIAALGGMERASAIDGRCKTRDGGEDVSCEIGVYSVCLEICNAEGTLRVLVSLGHGLAEIDLEIQIWRKEVARTSPCNQKAQPCMWKNSLLGNNFLPGPGEHYDGLPLNPLLLHAITVRPGGLLLFCLLS
ncbi:hypothetical protein M011DRAFT_292094 [Sporormia fimetaria CBS 119925]|uniref:Uncharacterized protein n=1 Tax=Sporormia fimetaria CBS 119925 TaxID=1340428 RepID=A0A6A6UYT7_9PLEO|nr:hypothetical protein M011DRAFT_292094 [Sporormia fimetaria CBS 119925]